MNPTIYLAGLSGGKWLALVALASIAILVVRLLVRASKPGNGTDPDDEGQGIRRPDHDQRGSSFAHMHGTVIDPKGSRAYYKVWGAHDEKPLPRKLQITW